MAAGKTKISLTDDDEVSTLLAGAQAASQSASRQSVPVSGDELAGPVVKGDRSHLPRQPVSIIRAVCACFGCVWRKSRRNEIEYRSLCCMSASMTITAIAGLCYVDTPHTQWATKGDFVCNPFGMTGFALCFGGRHS